MRSSPTSPVPDPVPPPPSESRRARGLLMHAVLQRARPLGRLPRWLRLGAATTVVLALFALRLSFGPLLSGYPFLFFLPAVMAVALVFDRATCIYASLLSTVLALVFLLPPVGGLVPSDPGAWIAAAVFLAVSVVIALVVEAMRAALDAVADSEVQFRAVFESAAAGMAQTEFRGGRFLRVNGALCRMLGYPREELQGLPWTALTHPEDLEADLAPFRRMAAGELDSYALEKRFLHKDGHTVWARLSLSLVRDAQGRPDYEIAVVEDIGERRATQAALAESTARLRMAMEAGGMGVWDWDLVADRLTWDGRQFELFGRDPSQGQPLGEEALARVHPDDVGPLRAAIGSAVASGDGIFQAEFRVLRDDGSLQRWVAGYGRAVAGPDGRAVRMVGFNYDITERRLAQDALAESGRQAQLAAERVQLALAAGAIVGTWVWDLTRGTFTVDESFARAFGLEPALGRSGLSLAQVVATVHPQDEPALRAAIDAAIARGGPYRHQYRVRQHDGVYRWIEANGRVEHDAQGRAVRFPGVLLDIEERRAIESERHRAMALLQAFIEAVPAVVYAKDTDGRMLVANEATAAVLGRPLAEILGRRSAELVPDPAEAAQIDANDRRVMHSGVPEQVEEQLTRPGGSPGTYLSTKAPFRDEHGRVIGLVGASVDITERKRAEAVLTRDKAELEGLVEERTAGLLRAADERRRAEEAMRQGEKLQALGQLTGGIAHDFNNMLQVVASGIAILRMPQLPPERRERILEGMARASRNASDLTRRLLSFARQQPLRPEALDLNERVGAMAELLRHSLGSGVEVQTDLAIGLPRVTVDPTQLETAVLNLALNARDAMRQGGVLTIATGRDAATGLVVLAVADTGEGMSDALLARLFEPFFTTKPAGQGTGLGLAQVHGFAKQSGGDVRVHSEPGAGTRFELLLPPAEPGAVAQSLAPLAQVRPADKTVLVVDDNADVAAFVGTLLGELGYRVRHAASAEEALALVAGDEPVDAVFSDIVMPGGRSGLELAELLQRDHPGTAVVLASGYSEQLARAGRAPCEVLAKPYVLGDVAQALQRAFGRVAQH